MYPLIKTRNFWLILAGDILLLFLSHYMAYYLRFDGRIPASQVANLIHTTWWILLIKVCCFYLFRMYRGMWRYTSIHDMLNLLKACVVSSGLIAIVLLITVRFSGFSRGIFIIDFFLTFLLVGGYRLGIRLLYDKSRKGFSFHLLKQRPSDLKRVLLIGAGSAGEKLLREIMENAALSYDVAGFLDDDPQKRGHAIHGVPVLGPIQDIEKIVHKEEIEEIIIAISAVSSNKMRKIVRSCEETGLPCRTLPGIGELIEGKVSVSAIREIRYVDLLGRGPVRLNLEQVENTLTDRTVLVTGGAGSIGSELCRQIIRYNPRRLIIVDINESDLYDLKQELSGGSSKAPIVPVLAPVHVQGLMHRVFQEFTPHVVFHAAAYKHVPMMEIYPREAVFNNILGTEIILSLCVREGVERCVLVSTDKAVRPANVMGASKRFGELLMEAYQQEYGARLMAVRFGNVVGSRGSVVPLFQQQIQRGGPVTVTHPEVTRYFMTIPEACRLILQAGALGRGGEIFVLKMGIPIRIADMAEDLIRLSGHKPHEEIPITFTGLRPGEKLSEELITEGEGIEETEHEHILVLRGQNGLSLAELTEGIQRLIKMAERGDCEKIREELRRMVPEYTLDVDGGNLFSS